VKIKNISAISFIISVFLIISIIVSAVFAGYWYYTSEKVAKDDIETIKKVYMDNSKQYAKSMIENIIKTIDSERKQDVADMKKEVIMNRVIYKHLEHMRMMYGEYATKKKMKLLLRRYLEDKTFSDPSISYYIFDAKGNCVVNPYDINAEGKNFINLKDFKGNSIIRDIIKTAKTKKEDFINQYFVSNWYDLNPASIKQKGITFVKYYKPFDWVLVTRIDTEYLEGRLKRKWLNQLSLYRYGKDNHGYIFVIKLLNINGGNCFGKMLVNVNRPDLLNKCMSDEYTDVRGFKFRKIFLKDIRNKGYSFVEYYYKVPNSDKVEKKISCFRLYKPWHWIFATGIYINDLKPIINTRVSVAIAHLNAIKHTIVFLILLMMVVALLFLFILKKVTRSYTDKLFNEFDQSLRHSRSIDSQKCAIKELSYIIDKFNSLIKRVRRYENDLKKIALYDELTGLYNRRFVSRTEDLIIKNARRSGNKLGILMCDIDFFKKVNDTYGHDVGDEVLKNVAKIMTKSVRESDVVVRFGGEEFLIFLINADKKNSFEIAENIRKRVESSSIKINGTSINVTISIGVSEFSGNDNNFDKAIKLADLALYKAKNSGRNKTVMSEKQD